MCAINLIFTIMVVRAPQGLKNITGQYVFYVSCGIVKLTSSETEIDLNLCECGRLVDLRADIRTSRIHFTD
jgi:hypothetical protein